MPIDEWQKGRDRDVARSAARDYAANGRYTGYDSVYDDLPPDRSRKTKAAEQQPETLTDWLNFQRGRCRLKAKPARFSKEPGPAETGAIPLLLDVLGRCRRGDRAFVAQAAGLIGDPAARAIVNALRSEDLTVRRNAVAVLERLGQASAHALIALQRTACSATAEQDRRSLDELDRVEISPTLAAAFDSPAEIDYLITAAANDDPRCDREFAERRLAGRGRAGIDGLLRALHTGEARYCEIAVRVLPRFGGLALTAVPALKRLAASGGAATRAAAAACLEKLRLNRSLFGPEEPPSSRRTAVAGVPGIPLPVPQKVALLVEALGDRDSGVRFAAARAIEKIGRPARDAVPALHKAFRGDWDNAFKAVVLDVICSLGAGTSSKARRRGTSVRKRK